MVDDKFITHTTRNWRFGKDNTGNLTEKENMKDLQDYANFKLVEEEEEGEKEWGKGGERESSTIIHLVTADGSVDCQTNPKEQERDTHNLHLCEMVTALSVLAVGGSFVIKKFTMFESETVNLLYFLCCVFNKVHIFKPGTSKGSNSEVYVVCLGYLGKNVCLDQLQKLRDYYGQYDDDDYCDFSMFGINDLPLDFMTQLKNCVKFFTSHQINAINKNISLYGKITKKEKRYLQLLKFKACQIFLRKNYCSRISIKQSLTQYKVNEKRFLLESDLTKSVTDCFIRRRKGREERGDGDEENLKDLIPVIKHYVNEYIKEFFVENNNNNWWKKNVEIISHQNEEKNNKCKIYHHHELKFLAIDDVDKIDFDVIRGKPFTRIENSKFCSQKVLKCFKILYKFWEKTNNNNNMTMDDEESSPLLLQLISSKRHHHHHLLNARILKSGGGDDNLLLTPKLGAALKVFSLIRRGEVKAGDSFILFNMTLLSRLQYGLLCLLSGAFQNIKIYTSHKLGADLPIILLEKFKSIDHGEKILRALKERGIILDWWGEEDDDDGVVVVNTPLQQQQQLLQIVSYSQLLENDDRLCSIFYYNIHHCLYKLLKLLHFFENLY